MKAKTHTHGPSFICTYTYPHIWVKVIIFIQLTAANHGTIYLIDFIIFIQPLRSGRIWHKVNFLSGV